MRLGNGEFTVYDNGYGRPSQSGRQWGTQAESGVQMSTDELVIFGPVCDVGVKSVALTPRVGQSAAYELARDFGPKYAQATHATVADIIYRAWEPRASQSSFVSSVVDLFQTVDMGFALPITISRRALVETAMGLPVPSAEVEDEARRAEWLEEIAKSVASGQIRSAVRTMEAGRQEWIDSLTETDSGSN